MAEMLFGVETEYAVAGSNLAGPMGQEDILRGLLNRAHKELVYLPGLYSVSGVFLGNGSRFYADCGNHPELCTPECIERHGRWCGTSWQGTGYLAGLAASLEKECTPPERRYCASAATWTIAGRIRRGAATRATCTAWLRRSCGRRLFLTW
jgi:hypothetical protein